MIVRRNWRAYQFRSAITSTEGPIGKLPHYALAQNAG